MAILSAVLATEGTDRGPRKSTDWQSTHRALASVKTSSRRTVEASWSKLLHLDIMQQTFSVSFVPDRSLLS